MKSNVMKTNSVVYTYQGHPLKYSGKGQFSFWDKICPMYHIWYVVFLAQNLTIDKTYLQTNNQTYIYLFWFLNLLPHFQAVYNKHTIGYLE